VRLQSTSPSASETINHVIYALNNTFHEVEQAYRVWRNERIQSVLQHGKLFFRQPYQQSGNETDPSTRCRFPLRQSPHSSSPLAP
jgi:hypothetical protein